MKILIKNAYNTYNYGSMMMCENIIKELNKRINGIVFFIDNATEDNVERLKKATEYSEIYSANLYNENYKLKSGFLAKVERKLKYDIYQYKIVKNAKKYDAILVLGGDDYAETYDDKKYALKMLKQLNSLNKKTNLIMIGQTIGPYTEERKEYAQKLFPNIKLYTRDDISSQYIIKELNAKPHISRDLAWLDLKLQEKYEQNYNEILKKYKLEDNKYIVIVGTGLAKWYCNNEDNFYSNFIKIINNIKIKYPNKKVVWLSHVTTEKPALSDNTMLDMINLKYNNYINENLVVIREQILPVEARIILGHAYFTITCRMHSAVSSFQMGKPAICLSYSSKYKGVIADGLKMNNLVIEAKNEELWKNEIVELVNNKIEYVEENYDDLKMKIRENVNNCKNIVEETLNEIATILK
jgi:colanic acid/amylovoran biosynthesis protein